MKTKVIRIQKSMPSKKTGKQIAEAARIIIAGGIVAFPTETVYGLGANALDAEAIRKIFRAKGRPFDDPLIVHIASKHQLYGLAARVTAEAKILMKKFWPGPLTLVLRKTKKVPKITTAGLDTVAIRMPSHPIALGLICATGVPIAAPSANTFGRPSPTSARDVLEDLDCKIDAVIDAGRTRIGVESTVLDLSGKTPVLLRPGNITLEQLEKTIGKIKVHPLVRVRTHGTKPTKKTAVRSPGLAYRHYAPRAEVILVEGPAKWAEAKIKKIKAGLAGKKVVVLKTSGLSKEKLASRLFGEFRVADRKGADIIIVQGVDEQGIGLAVMNRVRKAAARIVKS